MSGDYLGTRMENHLINKKIVRDQDLRLFMNGSEFHSALMELEENK